MNTSQNPVKLDRCDRQLLAKLENMTEAEQLELLRDLRAERSLEIGIYNHREQWMWAPWIACLTVAGIAQTSPSPVIRVGMACLTGTLALVLSLIRQYGLKKSFEAINLRHKWVVALTSSLDAPPAMRVFTFEDRLIRLKSGAAHDEDHVRSFNYPAQAWWLTLLFWLPLIGISVASCLGK